MTSVPALVSVIIPAFNAETTLAETGHSALSSTYPDIEVIIVDDGSTDRTPAIAAHLAKDSRVRVLTQANRGLPAALNAAVSAARGEFIARLDADDLWHRTKLAKQAKLALGPGSPDFIYSFYRYVDDRGLVDFDGPPQRFPPRALRRSIYEPLSATGSSLFMRKRALEELGGFDETYPNSEDLLFQVKAASRHRFDFVPEYLVGYRRHLGSMSRDAAAMRDVWFELSSRLRRDFPQVPAAVHNWVHARRCMSMAEGFARNRQFGEAARLFGASLGSDALWTLAFAAHRTGRLARRNRHHVEGAGLPFMQYDPEEPLHPLSSLYGTEGMLMGHLHKQRVRHLAALDKDDS